MVSWIKEIFNGLWNVILSLPVKARTMIVVLIICLTGGYFFYDSYNDTKVRLVEASRPPHNWKDKKSNFVNRDSKIEKQSPSKGTE